MSNRTPYSDRDSAEGAAPLGLEERQDPERDQPQCDQDEQPRAEGRLGERAEHPVDALSSGEATGLATVLRASTDVVICTIPYRLTTR